MVPLAGLGGQKEEDEKEDLTELLDLDVVLVVDVIGGKHNILPWTVMPFSD